MFKVDNRNLRKRHEICSNLAIKTPEPCHWHRSSAFIGNFEHFTPFSSVSIVDFKEVNVSWVI